MLHHRPRGTKVLLGRESSSYNKKIMSNKRLLQDICWGGVKLLHHRPRGTKVLLGRESSSYNKQNDVQQTITTRFLLRRCQIVTPSTTWN